MLCAADWTTRIAKHETQQHVPKNAQHDTKNTKHQVALKRIPDVLASLENAKRVLREVCILRRLAHPGVVALRDVFLRPAPTGRLVMRRGQLVPTSLDLYLALEYCDQVGC